MNSFLFNVSLILLTSVSVTQFCAASFRDYCSMTDIDLIFSTQIRYLYFFIYFYKYHVFEYALFVSYWSFNYFYREWVFWLLFIFCVVLQMLILLTEFTRRKKKKCNLKEIVTPKFLKLDSINRKWNNLLITWYKIYTNVVKLNYFYFYK